LVKTIEDPAFFEGRYRGKIITVHSNLRGEERDETVAQLITVEDPGNPTEIVVHVNMLKEGWDVTNLYTIVPLRAANSQTLVEQSIGRGLRLPYGKRTGVEAVDRLTIVAHDRFQEIVDYAKDPNSVIRGGLKVVFVKDEASKAVTVQPEVLRRLAAPFPDAVHEEVSLYEATKRLEVAQMTLDVIHDEFERLSRSRDLAAPDVQENIVARVRERLPATQVALEGIPSSTARAPRYRPSSSTRKLRTEFVTVVRFPTRCGARAREGCGEGRPHARPAGVRPLRADAASAMRARGALAARAIAVVT
jgi:type III restriction enzyme